MAPTKSLDRTPDNEGTPSASPSNIPRSPEYRGVQRCLKKLLFLIIRVTELCSSNAVAEGFIAKHIQGISLTSVEL